MPVQGAWPRTGRRAPLPVLRRRLQNRIRRGGVGGDRLLDHFDERVSALLKEDPPSAQAVARALAHRYLKRVVAHLMNVLSAVIMPLDRLDYYDEDPEDRRGD